MCVMSDVIYLKDKSTTDGPAQRRGEETWDPVPNARVRVRVRVRARVRMRVWVCGGGGMLFSVRP